MKTTRKVSKKKTSKTTKASTHSSIKPKRKPPSEATKLKQKASAKARRLAKQKRDGIGKAGRPKIQIDMRLAKKLMGKFHTQEDISDVMGISVDTLMRSDDFAETYKRNTVAAKTSIRAGLYKYALLGDAALLKFLAKNYLGLSENPVDMDERKIAEPIKIILAHSIKPPVYRRPPKVDEDVAGESDYEDDDT